MVRSIHIATSLDDEASGPSYTVPALARALVRQGHPSGIASLSSSEKLEENEGVVHRKFTSDCIHPEWLRQLKFSRGLFNHLQSISEQSVLFHVHGLWRMPNVYPGQLAHASGQPMILAPRGMLAPEALAFSRWQKMVFWHGVQRRALSALSCWHATSEAEYDDIRRFGERHPVAILPNGIDVGVADPVAGRVREVLHLGRIHPKKGIDRLLEAWARIESRHPDWRLRIVGPDESGHTAELKAQAERLRLQRVRFDGPLFGEEKRAAYRRAALFVLPTRNENFGMVVAEALAEGTPVVCTKGAPWQGLETHSCGWWVDRNADALADTMAVAMATPPAALSEMGARGHAWMARDFGWDSIALRMAEVYMWCLGKRDRPNYVVLD